MRAPLARPSIVADKPTGPCPKTATVSRPETSLQRRVGSANAARNRRAFLEREFVGQRHECACRNLHEVGMATVSGYAVHGHPVTTQLWPSNPAVFAAAASLVVMNHDPCVDRREVRRNANTRGDDNATWFVTRDRSVVRSNRRGGRPVMFQIAAAHARRLDGHDDVAWTWRRIGEVTKLQPSIAQEDYPAHRWAIPDRSPSTPSCR